MTIKEQLWQEIESSSEEILLETLDFLQYLKIKKTASYESQKQSVSTGKSLLEHLANLPDWAGDDLEECLSTVQQTRAKAKFNSFNPFESE